MVLCENDLLEKRDFNNIKKLLETKFDINVIMLGNRTPIHYASYHNDIKTLKYLINKGVDIYQKDILGYTPAQYAIGNSSVEALKLLVANGIDIREIYYIPSFGHLGQGQKRYLFDDITYHCNYELAKVIVESGIDLNDNGKYTSYSVRGIMILDVLLGGKCKRWQSNPKNKDNLKKMEKLYREYGALSGKEIKKLNTKKEEKDAK